MIRIRDIPLQHIHISGIRFERLVPYLLLLLICVPALTLRLAVYPPIWFDEGYKTNAARTLAEYGVYGTYSVEGFLPFDPGISSGPADIAAVALMFKLFGTGIAQARLAIICFTLLGLLMLYSLAAYLYGRAAGLFCTLLMLAAPPIQGVSFLAIGRQVLGESPSLALMLLGWWLWLRSWERNRWLLSILAGLALGLGLLSKTQTGIALLPAMLVIAIGYGRNNRMRLAYLVAPIIIMLGVVVGWSIIGRLGTDSHQRQENSILLLDAIKTNLVTGLFGRTLTSSAWIIIALMLIGGGASGWRLVRQAVRMPYSTARFWAEALIVTFVLFSAGWFAVLSVGWPRYAYAGLILATILICRSVWDIFHYRLRQLQKRWSIFSNYGYRSGIVAIALLAAFTNIYPLWRAQQDTKAQEAADYIHAHIPQDAVVETWEWELDALSDHWRYHHPNQRYLFLAIRQFSHDQQAFHLNYDMLQANPDYLIIGGFGDWTHIYDQDITYLQFSQLAEIGAYRIYKRVR
jgi:4-amino-4-deoxy-L-arabinose transferase-like glycosyltransferase